MYEDITFERLLEDVLKRAPDGIDTRQGSIYYDAVSGVLLKLAKFYTDLDVAGLLSTINTATGEMLDTRAAEFAMYRLKATPAKYRALFTGAVPKVGERFYFDGVYFKAALYEADNTVCLEAEKPGVEGNDIYANTPAVPVNTIPELKSAAFGSLLEAGSDIESDEDFRSRIWEKINGPAENGNRQHYKTWCESIDGIGLARIIPLWNGVCTVMAVLIDTEGNPCGAEKVAEVQQYIDPADKGMTVVVDGKTYVMGDGLGNGVANIGAHFTAVAAEPVNIEISFKAELAEGAVLSSVKADVETAVRKYFKELVLSAGNAYELTVRLWSVNALLTDVPYIVDCSGLKLNGQTGNVIINKFSVPMLSGVVIT